MQEKIRLGANLAAVLGPNAKSLILKEASDETLMQIQNISTAFLAPSSFQPRRNFDIDKLSELSESIRKQGILQPLIVRKHSAQSGYEIIAGERRWRAAKQVNLSTVPVIVRDIDDKTAMAFALIENIQRHDLGPIDEAIAFKNLIEQHQITHQDLANLVSKSRATISNTLRLLNLDNQVQKLLNDGLIEAGHAKVLLALEVEKQYEIASLIVQKNLSVREVENIIKKIKEGKSTTENTVFNLLNHQQIKQWADLLTEKLTLPFMFKASPKGQGATLTIKFDDLSEAGRFVENFKVES